MGFSKEWEEAYKNNTQMSVWPWSDLVSYIYRYTDIKRRKLRVLELGCGAGANIRLFDELGVDYYGIDGSATIIKMLHNTFPREKYPSINLVTGDFTKDIPFEGNFDIIFDRAALTHNTTQAIRRVSKMIAQKLNANGLFIGIDWFSTNHADYKQGIQCDDDIHTKFMGGSVDGQFQGLGNVHFSDEKHLKDIFSDYEIVVLEEKTVKSALPKEHIFASWNFVAKLR